MLSTIGVRRPHHTCGAFARTLEQVRKLNQKY